MGLHSTEAIVIGGHDLAEADRIVVFFTHAFGKVRAVAAGARRMRTKFGGSLQLFTQGRLVYFERPNRTLHRINEFAVTRSHQALRDDLHRMAIGSMLVESVAVGVEEGDAFPDLYHLLADGLELLAEARRPSLVLQGFTLHLLGLLGYLPELSECVSCRRKVGGADPAHISPSQGGLVCMECRPAVSDAIQLSPTGLAFIRQARTLTLRVIARESVAPQALQEVSEILLTFLRHVLGRPLRSGEFLNHL
jgi:DNA repair protein RecO (recombination protein O)